MKFVEGWYLPDNEKHFSQYLIEAKNSKFPKNIKKYKETIQSNMLKNLTLLLILGHV